MANKFSSILATVQDIRRTHKGNYRYSMEEIFFVVTVGAICGYDSWETISSCSKLNLDWFRKYYPYNRGIPSHDTLERFFSKLNSSVLGEVYINWAASIFKCIDNEVISIDGKRMCGSGDKAKEQAALHIVSAFATANELTLAQVATDAKSNEITAIPVLLDMIEIKDTIVSIDAMGCQKEIAKKIRKKEAHYLLAVKDNQKELHQNIIQSFELEGISDSNVWLDMGHGRIENRTCQIITDLKWIEGKDNWQDLKTIVCISSERTIKKTGETQYQKRYYISSKQATAHQFNRMIRSHWAIENKLHWNLDVVFKEDKSKKRKGSSAHNFNIIRKIALKILDKNKGKLTKPTLSAMASTSNEIKNQIINSF